METTILVINCGSSSIKFSLTHPRAGTHLLTGLAENLSTSDARLAWQGNASGDKSLNGGDHKAALQGIVALLEELNLSCDGIGHRVVHGGEHFSGACPVNDDSLEALRDHIHLAPLHNPVNLLGIEAARAAFPDLPQVMVFDTSFHQSMPKRAYLYALPYELYKEHGIRKYGFHGTSHRYVSEEAARRLGQPLSETALVTAHLGNGCSVAAVRGGVSADTSMGLTPLEGLMMGSRSGDVDPSLFGFLRDRCGYDVDDPLTVLNRKRGYFGVSGHADSRDLEDAVSRGEPGATLALDMFCYKLAKYVASYVVPLGGSIDALVFTAGIGERSPVKRARILKYLAPLGFRCDEERNAANASVVSPEGHSPVAMVIPTNEELVIAQETITLIRTGKAKSGQTLRGHNSGST